VNGGIWTGSLWKESADLYVEVEVEELAVKSMIIYEQDGMLASEEFTNCMSEYALRHPVIDQA
jgi:hypothetical protein